MRILFLLLFFSLSTAGQAQNRYWVHSPQVVLPRGINTIEMLHVDFDTRLLGTKIQPGQVVGYTSEMPLIRSVRYGLALVKSEEAYGAGRYAEAAALVEEAYQKEPDNPFILNQLARALYRTDAQKPRAHTLYQQLVNRVRSAVPASDSAVVVDAQFAEAYWKLGTLHMDNAQWAEALLCISQAVLAAPTDLYAGSKLQEQMLQYQTECLFELGEADLCRQFGQQTLRLFPRNTYVRPYLARLPRLAPGKIRRK
ncbi:tetratricopeptide repeat protein [Hymenobacter metallilatus]|uniref:Tetratricopeptide repeat protein n=1 Tax=Hymenobacter metallilatus TaxID=2493666 RepID=A0A428JPE1_9BACT|nr:tetratricopeptide repeat protein [Hymenobacter metallilatus]RSK35166.1 tetratricopeptide repeat protein [Hymenobacter metallilatus]